MEEMQNLNNIVQSEQLNRNGRIPESNRSIRSLYKHTKGRNVLNKIVLPAVLGLFLTGCSEFALLTSGAGVAVNNNTIVKAYNGIDLATTITTKKSIKTHAYDNVKKSIDTAKEIKKITQQQLELQNELKHLKMKKEVENYEQ
jgi:Na+/H+ antiporter NhaC|tara:strand:- start:598 stop:1026 length:429 start_codon:yes stop_codon:yes gene_type:complete